jgi:hypothetical protein
MKEKERKKERKEERYESYDSYLLIPSPVIVNPTANF